jgi:hypothetical protein
VKQHLGRQSGVQNVEVNLLDGKVEVTPKEDGQVDPAQLVKATYDSGVTLAEMRITARGRLREEPGKGWVFEISPTKVYPVTPNEQLKPLQTAPEPVTLTGILYRKPAKKLKKNEPPVFRLEILTAETG